MWKYLFLILTFLIKDYVIKAQNMERIDNFYVKNTYR
jgi:hypothetical protein